MHELWRGLQFHLSLTSLLLPLKRLFGGLIAPLRPLLLSYLRPSLDLLWIERLHHHSHALVSVCLLQHHELPLVFKPFVGPTLQTKLVLTSDVLRLVLLSEPVAEVRTQVGVLHDTFRDVKGAGLHQLVVTGVIPLWLVHLDLLLGEDILYFLHSLLVKIFRPLLSIVEGEFLPRRVFFGEDFL